MIFFFFLIHFWGKGDGIIKSWQTCACALIIIITILIDKPKASASNEIDGADVQYLPYYTIVFMDDKDIKINADKITIIIIRPDDAYAQRYKRGKTTKVPRDKKPTGRMIRDPVL